MPPAEMIARAKAQDTPRGFARALEAKREAGEFALIAEIKKASPSKGLIRADFDPAALARAYEDGRRGLPVRCSPTRPSFQGAPEYLAGGARAAALPALRKDFLSTLSGLRGARLGRRCDPHHHGVPVRREARALEETAFELGMECLVEVHDEPRWTARSASRRALIGINNRDLRTFEVDLETSRRLAQMARQGSPAGRRKRHLHPRGLPAARRKRDRRLLVGESLMRQADVAAATRGASRRCTCS